MTPIARRIFKTLGCSGARLGMEKAADIVNNYCTRDDINEYQYGALVLFAERRGAQAFYLSKLLRLVNEDFGPRWELRVAREFLNPRWAVWRGRKTKRMAERQQAEHRLWSTPIFAGGKDLQKE